MKMIESGQKIYTVSELSKGIKQLFENTPFLNNVWVKGEVSNVTYHTSGHIYFTLKDAGAIISAVFFKYANKNLTFKLEEGMSIFVCGNITAYEKRGSYQINVLKAKLEGEGELQKKIEALKNRLLEEGIFNDSHKRPLPFFPQRIGIVTSPTGAAVRDIIKVALRRYPNIEMVIAPAKVQGDESAESIALGIKELNKKEYNIDVIIAGRGGGSFEDLMAFNEEVVVRAFYNSEVPIISAVGHQIDHPLSDDAADVAAPTPSAAAEVAIPVKKDLYDEIQYYLIRCENRIYSDLRDYRNRIESVTGRRVFRDPMELINLREMYLTEMENRLSGVMRTMVHEKKQALAELHDIRKEIRTLLREREYRFSMALQALEAFSPLNVLKRGYTITRKEENIIKTVSEIQKGDRVDVQFSDGILGCLVEEKTIQELIRDGKKAEKNDL